MITPRTWKKGVIKSMLCMALLVLFVPQFSYKFYLCANNPSWTFKAQNSPRLSHERPAFRSIAFEHCRPLSIDKRYCLKHLDALLPVQLRPAVANPGDRIYAMRPAPGLIHLFGLTRSLRGPPQASIS